MKYVGFTPREGSFYGYSRFGELKMEFYAHLGEIKDLYFNQGIVIFKVLHKMIVEKYHLSLDYQAFCYYARKELKGGKGGSVSSSAAVTTTDGRVQEEREEESQVHSNEGDVIIAVPNLSRVKRFVPYEGENN